METMDFQARFIALVKSCVSSAKFSMNINGSLQGFFGSSRGLRHYLFLLIMDMFGGVLRRESSKGFTFHPKCKKISLNHLLFADDMFLLVGADSQSFRAVQRGLKEFSKISGLHSNFLKAAFILKVWQRKIMLS
ncbi:hypothetical protein LIER_07571 [Lithospermum erythrorhizon]|uniref:Reverse transcriptase n=1 Tax=Lithospermum erythrorhizon TaxID=34254 RepID=A0AAV3P9B8_LITER